MSDHAPRPVERHCDVAVVGGSAAGLAAALQLGRQRRSVIVVDAGAARNRPSTHPHDYRGGEGISPTALIAAGRKEVRRYGGEVLTGRVSAVTRTDSDYFRVVLAEGHHIVARRVLAATGLVDELPPIDGIAECSGRDVIHCPDGRVQAVELASHDRLTADVIAVGPRFTVCVEPFVALGIRPVAHPSGLGDFVETDATGETSVPGLYAAGNVTDPSQHFLQAAADGSRVGAMISFSLAADDLRVEGRQSANEADWDHRYAGERIWSGNPNGTLFNEISGMVPGRALDVGAGEGGDALWLARQGWRVTASDISQRALDRIASEATRHGLHIEGLHMDANALNAFGTAGFDLVSAQYASIPRTPDSRGVRNLVDAVAPGGTILIVSHNLEAMRTSDDAPAHNMPFDPDAFLRTDDFEVALSDSNEWDIEVNENRPRPPGAASASHHVEDVVLRARRRAS